MIKFKDTLVIAISSRALFDLSDSHAVFEKQGLSAYCQYQIDHENDLLRPGVAFNMAKKFLALNNKKKKRQVEIVLVSKNSADTGLRIFNSIQHYALDISRAAFTSGHPTSIYTKPFGTHLFLSADANDVAETLATGTAAATILPSKVDISESTQLKIAFDGDAVLFSDEAEQIYQSQGLQAFTDNEREAANQPLPGGPFKPILAALHRIQDDYPASDSPIRTALITARAAPAHERVIRTLRAWNIRIDEAFFLGGMDKGQFLKTFGADIFFDDQSGHCDSARHHVATGHVNHGISNQIKD